MDKIIKQLEVTIEQKGLRLDVYLAEALGISRSQLKNQDVQAVYKGKELKFSYKLEGDEVLTVQYNPEEEKKPIVAQKMDFDILYEDADVLVINKEQGLLVHPGAGIHGVSLMEGLLAHVEDFKNMSKINVMYSGEFETPKYKRFMLIGKKK